MDRSDPPASREIQPAQERTIEEVKVEARERAERGAYPLIGLDPADGHEALTTVKTQDRDEWAAAWSAVADRYYRAAERSTSVDERRSNYLRAWRLYFFAQWPVPSSAGKKAPTPWKRLREGASAQPAARGRPQPLRRQGDRRLPAPTVRGGRAGPCRSRRERPRQPKGIPGGDLQRTARARCRLFRSGRTRRNRRPAKFRCSSERSAFKVRTAAV
jgi:hypothetical protein